MRHETSKNFLKIRKLNQKLKKQDIFVHYLKSIIY